MFGQFVLEPVVLAIIVAGFISLLFNYLPALRVWFAGLQSQFKSLMMIGILVLVSLAVWGAGCFGFLAINLTCDKAGLIQLAKIFVATILANQSVYMLAPQTADVKLAKNIRDVITGEVAPATPAVKAEAKLISDK